MDGVVTACEGLLRSGGGFGRVSGPASICVGAVGMAQIQGTVPVGGQRRWVGQAEHGQSQVVARLL